MQVPSRLSGRSLELRTVPETGGSLTESFCRQLQELQGVVGPFASPERGISNLQLGASKPGRLIEEAGEGIECRRLEVSSAAES